MINYILHDTWFPQIIFFGLIYYFYKQRNKDVPKKILDAKLSNRELKMYKKDPEFRENVDSFYETKDRLDNAIKGFQDDIIEDAVWDNEKKTYVSRKSKKDKSEISEKQKKPIKVSKKQTEADYVKSELIKYKEMLNEGLITKEAYDTKMKQLLNMDIK